MKSATYNALIPNPAKHKRTDGDREFFGPQTKKRNEILSGLRVQKTKPGLKSPSLISSYRGSMDRLLFAFPPYGLQEARFHTAYKSLISELRTGMKFVVVCQEDNKSVIEAWFTSAGHSSDHIEWAHLPPFTNFTDWAEDAYVGLVDAEDGQHYLMEPWEFLRAGDALIADAVEEFTGNIRAAQSPLMFQGGNCIVGDEHWFLGRDYYFDCLDLINTRRAPISVPSGSTAEEFVFHLFREYIDSSRELVLLGSNTPIPLPNMVATKGADSFFIDMPTGGNGSYQPIFHIDMLMSLIGDDGNGLEVMVGDPSLADTMLDSQSPFALAHEYQKIADQLSDLGMVVHRNPLVHWPTEGGTLTLSELEHLGAEEGDQNLLNVCTELRHLGAEDSSSVTGREWHHITWNNCLVENGSDAGKHVYLPTFGHDDKAKLEALDQHMKSMWEGFGYTVHMLGDFNAFAERSGVVHCISKYLARTA